MDDLIPGVFNTPGAVADGWTTSNATFEVSADRCRDWNEDVRALAIRLQPSVDAQVVISKEDVPCPTFVVESTWKDAVPASGMVSTEHQDTLLLNVSRWPSSPPHSSHAQSSEAAHMIHLIMPLSASHVPSLTVTSSSGLPISLHGSALDPKPLVMSHLEIITDADIELAELVAHDARFYTSTGDISGSYNVSGSLILKTLTGNIKADVSVQPRPPHLPPPGGPGKHHPPPPAPGHGGPPYPPPHHGHGEHPPPPHAPHGHHGEHPPHDHHHKDSSHRSHKKGKKGGKHHKREETPRQIQDHEDGGHKSSFLSRLFAWKDEKPHGPHHHHHHRPPPPPPPPVFIGAFTTNGSIHLDVWPQTNQTDIGVVVKTFSSTGDIFVNISEFFKGFFLAETKLGSLDIEAGKNKTLDIVRQVVTGKGALTKGFVHPNFTRKYHPHPDSEERQGDHQEEGGHVAEHRKRDEDEADMMDDGRYAIMALLRDSR
jgi:hypothetical protein